MKNILLLNPGGPGIIMRGLIRERPTQLGFCWPPVDLILFSGYLHNKGYKLKYIDASINNYSADEVNKEIKKNNIEAIVSLYSHFSKNNDINFLRNIKTGNPHLKIVILADVEHVFFPDKALRFLEDNDWLSAIVFDLIHNDLDKYLENHTYDSLINICYKQNDNAKIGKIVNACEDNYALPIPRHELFKNKRYFLPESRNIYVTTTCMQFGCSFSCAFCMDRLVYKKVWCRSAENMLEEFKHIAYCGFKEVYFRDLTFGLDRNKTMKFCQGLIKHKLPLKWVCSSRVDILDEEILSYMKRAGCMSIEFGVESGIDDTKTKYNKGIDNERIKKTFDTCRKLGIETAAFLIIGFPEEGIEDIKRSIKFVFGLKSDFLSINLANALPKTEFADRINYKNTVNDPWNDYFFDSLNFKHPNISEDCLIKISKETLMKFYLRPFYVIKRLAKIRSLGALIRIMAIGLNLVLLILSPKYKTKTN